MSDNVRFFVHQDYPVDENTRKLLVQMAQVEGVVKPIIALPDVHFKFSYHTPTGVVVLTKDRIIPKFVNANCGMSFIKTDFSAQDIKEKTIDDIFNYLKQRISVSVRVSPFITHGDFRQIIKKGAAWACDTYQLDANDLINFENQGSLFRSDPRPIDEILSYIPQSCQNVGLFSLGVLGYGNHFVELQEVEEIVNKEVADRFGIFKGQLCFMIHSDSRAFGQSVFDFYSKKAKKMLGMQRFYKNMHYRLFSSKKSPAAAKRMLQNLNHYLNRIKSTFYWKLDGLSKKSNITCDAIMIGTKEGEAYLAATYGALNYGYANRAYLASVVRDALRSAFDKKSAHVHILHDGNHDALQKETIDGEDFYVHRNGASMAKPARYFPNHPVFSHTGQPVLLPSSLGNISFLCAVTKGCKASCYSSSHGTGRLLDRGQARHIFKTEDVIREVRNKMKIYDYGKGYTAEESPAAFKDVEKVLHTLIQHDIAEPVARLKPLAALKGWR